MPPPVLQQSQIGAATDQIYLNSSSEGRLSAVGSSVGLPRPSLGLANDAEFRAMVRRIAQKRKLTRDAFLRLMESCLGPQFAKRSGLRVAAKKGDLFVEVDDASAFTPAGTIRLGAGQIIEDEVRFIYRDLENNRLTLDSSLRFGHAALVDAVTTLASPASVGDLTVSLSDSSKFPTSGYPYPVIIGQGTEREEVILVANNNTATNVLTPLSPIAQEHQARVPLVISGKVLKPSVAGQYFIEMAGGSDALENFPSSGLIRIDANTVNEETVRYFSIDRVDSSIQFARPLEKPHNPGATVNLVTEGEIVATAGVLQDGVHWEVYETQPSRVTLYIPADIHPLRLRDASWLHGATAPVVPTTISAPYTAPSLEISVTNASVLPSGGLYEIGANETFFAVNLWPASSKLSLVEPLANNYLAGAAVVPIQPVYVGTELADGNPIDSATGDWIEQQFPGHYVYNPADYAPSIIQTTLAQDICSPLVVAQRSSIGQTCIEVESAGTWPVPPFTTFDVLIGEGSGFEETAPCIDVTFASSAMTTSVPIASLPGDTYFKAINTSAFPDTGLGGEPAGYRIMIDRGTPTEEVAVVSDNDTALNEFYIPAGLQYAHNGATIELVNDVLTFSAKLTQPHDGPMTSPIGEGVTVKRLYDDILVADGSQFPSSRASVWLNFGRGRPDARARITSLAVPGTVVVSDSSKFPTVDYPYTVLVSDGAYYAEAAQVTNNNVGTGTLTLAANLGFSHSVGQYVTFKAGTPEVVDYSDRAGNVLYFSEPTTFPTRHTLGETVIYSPGYSEPNVDGTGYQFFLPPDPALCIRSVLDLVRAAGVKVQVITER